METTEKKNLPAIEELYKDTALIQQQNNLNILLNQAPAEKWVKNHPTAKLKDGPVKYLTIQRIEWLLTSVFIEWKIEVIDWKLIGNSVAVQVRLHYQDPISGDWKWQDGLGAAPLQTDKGAGATDFNALKSNAVMLALPAAESFAVKDAAHKLGKLFGKDMNRADEVLYDNLQEKVFNLEEIKKKLSGITTEEGLFEYYSEIPKKNKAVEQLFKQRRAELNGK
jgi:hypothetical protein